MLNAHIQITTIISHLISIVDTFGTDKEKDCLMNKNIRNSLRIANSATRDEFYTTAKTAEQFIQPLGDAGFYAGKHMTWFLEVVKFMIV